MNTELKDLLTALISRCETSGLTDKKCYIIEVEGWELDRLREAVHIPTRYEVDLATGELSVTEIDITGNPVTLHQFAEAAKESGFDRAIEEALRKPSPLLNALKDK